MMFHSNQLTGFYMIATVVFNELKFIRTKFTTTLSKFLWDHL